MHDFTVIRRHSASPTKPKKVVATAASKAMIREHHQWLNWPGCDRGWKVIFNNRLAEMQGRLIDPPRTIDWAMLVNLGVNDKIDAMLATRWLSETDGDFEIPMWKRIFELEEDVYREWCLEFYSTLILDKVKDSEVPWKQVVHFRLGGVSRHCTLGEFGYLTGMFTWEEIHDDRFAEFIKEGARDTTGFDDGVDANAYWIAISGKEAHTKMSKIADVRYPTLRILHKMIVHGFYQRSTHWDKVQVEELYLLRLFHEGEGFRYVNAPFALAEYLVKRGAGKMPSSKICGGHFITQIGRRLGLLTDDNIRQCSRGVQMTSISWGDLNQSGLLTSARRLIPEGARQEQEQEQPQAAPRRQRGQQDTWGFPELREELGVIRDSQVEMTRRMGVVESSQERLQEAHMAHQSLLGRMYYDESRYQPYRETWAQREAQTLGHTLPPYAPPDIFIPTQFPFQGGFYYPPPGQGGHAGASGSGVQQPQGPPQFGDYQGGTPSIFPDPSDVQD